jgi:hydroxymethylbilane synthase
MAMAGLKRVGLDEHVTHPFETNVCLPAPRQGALALEGRADDGRVRDYLSVVHDEPTAIVVECERVVLLELDAGCRAPVAIYAKVEGDDLKCDALVSDPKGERVVRASVTHSAIESDLVVKEIVGQLRDQGAGEIIAACRK